MRIVLGWESLLKAEQPLHCTVLCCLSRDGFPKASLALKAAQGATGKACRSNLNVRLATPGQGSGVVACMSLLPERRELWIVHSSSEPCWLKMARESKVCNIC